MIVSTTNIAIAAGITATPDSSLQDINVVADGDYSSVYTDALSGQVVINLALQAALDVGYIALGGTNIARKTSIKIETSTSVTGTPAVEVVNDSLLATESPVIMYKIDATAIRRVSITITGTGGISIAEIAMGDYYEIPRSYQAGYRRPWSVPNIKARSSVGLDSSPVNLSYESRTIQTSISVPNNIMADFDSGWYKFIKFAANNTFYVLEDDNKFHSYAGFNAVPAMTSAHSQTRTLGVSAITFNAFAKSTEALF